MKIYYSDQVKKKKKQPGANVSSECDLTYLATFEDNTGEK